MSPRITNWLIFAACVLITVICFINTGVLWPVVADTQDAIELNTGYLDFVKIMNLIFGFIFLILAVIFLIRALATYEGKFSWAKKISEKYFSKLNNIIQNRAKELEERTKALENLIAEQRTKSNEDFDIIPADYKLGKPVPSYPADAIPAFPSDKPKEKAYLQLGDFAFKGTTTTTATTTGTKVPNPKSTVRPLDELKAYYVTQNLKRR